VRDPRHGCRGRAIQLARLLGIRHARASCPCVERFRAW
jgi:hypothetical protein